MNSTGFQSVVSPTMSGGGSSTPRQGALGRAAAPAPAIPPKNGQPTAEEAKQIALTLAHFIQRTRSAPGTNQQMLEMGALAMRRGFVAILRSATGGGGGGGAQPPPGPGGAMG